jgi:hypothetical protein
MIDQLVVSFFSASEQVWCGCLAKLYGYPIFGQDGRMLSNVNKNGGVESPVVWISGSIASHVDSFTHVRTGWMWFIIKFTSVRYCNWLCRKTYGPT